MKIKNGARRKRHFCVLSAIGLLGLQIDPPAAAKDYFDPGLLELSGAAASTVDLSIFELADQAPPGNYLVKVTMNQMDQGLHAINFVTAPNGKLVPELSRNFLDQMKVNTKAIPGVIELDDEQPIENLPSLIPESKIQFDFSQQRLDISIPQIAMQSQATGSVDPSLWDNGVPALLMNYNLNGGRNWQSTPWDARKNVQTNLYADLWGGINYGPWRMRTQFTFTNDSFETAYQEKRQQQRTQFRNTYIQRDIQAWRSEILIGENSTSSDVFDGIPFRGIKLNSSDEMLPNSLQGFAPIISGTAFSNARVTVSQNGSVVYQTYVSPGPFRIDDLYQTGQSGDLTLTISETDGSVRTQIFPISSLPVMRRPGSLKYEVTTGRYNGGITVDSKRAAFVSGTLIYGLPLDTTIYLGGLAAQGYSSAVLGAGASLGRFGALSVDVTSSDAKIQTNAERYRGLSYRVRYAKSLLSTGTSVDLAAYRYSTRDYYSFADYNSLGYRLQSDQPPWALARQRSSFQLKLNQQLGRAGSLYATGSRNEYWGDSRVMNSLTVGYNGSYRGFGFGLVYSIDRIKNDAGWPENRQIFFSLQIPLDGFGAKSAFGNAQASYQFSRNDRKQVHQQVGLSGNALDSHLSYSLTQDLTNSQDSNADIQSSASAGYQGSKGMLNAGYSYSRNQRSLNMGGSGAIVVHPKGMTLSQTLGSSVAVVNAPGATDTQVMSGNVKTDRHGQAVVPFLSNYQKNSIRLDSASLPNDLELLNSEVSVYPSKGAIVMADFKTRKGYQALITLRTENGDVPFGSQVTAETTTTEGASLPNTAIVGDAGQVYLSGLSEHVRLQVKWGRAAQQSCRAEFSLDASPAATENPSIRMLTAPCHPYQ